MKKRSILQAVSVLAIFFGITVASGLVVFVGWTPPCWVAERLDYLSRSCAKEQLQSAVSTKNLEVIDITGMRVVGNSDRKVEFRSRLKQPSNDDLANIVFVDSVTFRISGHRWRLDSSTLHW